MESNNFLNMSEAVASSTVQFSSSSTSFDDLPDEIILTIASYLSQGDIEPCYNVSQRWRCIFNENKIWKKYCLYAENYLKTYNRLLKEKKSHSLAEATCLWRQYYECQTRLWKNWSTKSCKKETTGIIPTVTRIFTFHPYLDDRGNHWLFGNGDDGITVWNINGPVSRHSFLQETNQTGIVPLKDMLVTYSSNYIKVFKFLYPNYELEFKHCFILTEDESLSQQTVVSEEYYACNERYIIVGNVIIGYNENISNLHLPALHMWDLESGIKVATKDVFQQSFADYVFLNSGRSVEQDFACGLILFEGGGSDRFLVALIDRTFNLCQVSLYSFIQMRYVKVILQVRSRTVHCFMKNNVIAIWQCRYGDEDKSSKISIFDDRGTFLAKLDFPCLYNPALYGEFWFSEYTVILKVGFILHVLSIKDSNKISKHSFEAIKKGTILGFFEPKYLLLCSSGKFSRSVTVWDSESGIKLWDLGLLNWVDWSSYQALFKNYNYPGKLLLQFEGDKEFSILNFEI